MSLECDAWIWRNPVTWADGRTAGPIRLIRCALMNDHAGDHRCGMYTWGCRPFTEPARARVA